jgi:hypothetical protein
VNKQVYLYAITQLTSFHASFVRAWGIIAQVKSATGVIAMGFTVSYIDTPCMKACRSTSI